MSLRIDNRWLSGLSLGFFIAAMGGCSPSLRRGTDRAEPQNRYSYTYRVITRDCRCDEYSTLDSIDRIEYRFHASYMMDAGILTTIEIDVRNNANETLRFDHATAKVSSRNIAYQYNDRFLPLPDLTILPRNSETITLLGKETTGKDDWHEIAGEQLTITIRGLQLGEKEVKMQSVTFVPENPMMQDRR